MSFARSFSTRLKKAWGRFIAAFYHLAEPSPALHSAEKRYAARTLAFSTIGMVLAILMPLTVWATLFPEASSPALRNYFYFTTGVVVIGYLFSRTKYYWVGLYLILLTYSLGSVITSLSIKPLSPVAYVLLSGWNLGALILGAIFLQRFPFILLGLFNVVMLAIPAWQGLIDWYWFKRAAILVVSEALILFGTAGSIRRRARELSRSERRFRELFQSTLEGLVIHNADSILAVNRAFKAMFRCPADEAVGRRPLDFIAPDERERVYQEFLATRDDPNAVLRATALRADGTTFPAEARTSPVFFENQRVWAISVRDISQRVAAQQALQRERDFLKQVMDAVSEPFLVVDAHTYEVRLANKAARALAETQSPRYCYQLHHDRKRPCPADDPTTPCPLAEVRKTKQPVRVEHVHHRDGHTYIAAVHGYPLFDEEGRLSQVVIYTVDITRRKQAEAQLRKLQRAVEQSAHSIVITDKNGIIEYVNPAFTKVTGYTFEEAIGQNPRILKSGKHPPEFYKAMWDTLLQGKVFLSELVNRRKDGSLYWERASIAPIKNEKGEITHFVAIKEDITERKKLEEALQKARDEALEANRFKTQLLGNVSHDMRTPLGGILGYTEMLLDGAFGEPSEGQRQALMRILQSTQHLIDFTNDLLNQAELESGRIRLNITEFDPRTLFKVVPSSAAIAEAKGLQVHTEIDPRLPQRITGDPYWLRQILANLLSNAVKFTEKGHIWVRLRQIDDHHWAIEVEDTGEGIPEEAHERIFEPFRQVDGSPQRRHKGSGLGLSIVKQLVDLMHGEIRLQSAPGQGSKFTIILPCQAKQSSEESTS